MDKLTQPSKEKVRDWLQHRRLKNDPPPDIAQIRRELGWGFVEPVVDADKTRSHRLVVISYFNLA